MFMFKTGMIEPTMVEICGMVSIEERAIVFEIDPVAIVTGRGRVVIIGIAGEICFAYGGSGIVASGINRCWGVDYGGGDGGAYINPGSGYAETDMRTDDYLRIAFAGDEAGGYNGGKDK